MTNKWIVSGAYGVGKSEFCVQWALQHAPSTIADLDYLNPFFRPREIKEYLEENNVNVVSSHIDEGLNQDVPAISFAYQRALLNQEALILDCAGSENGLRPLLSLNEEFDEAQFWVVVNLNREESKLDKLDKMIALFEENTHRKVNGFVHNTHLLDETDALIILNAQKQLESYAQKKKIPIVVTMIDEKFKEALQTQIQNELMCFKKKFLRENWMKGVTQ